MDFPLNEHFDHYDKDTQKYIDDATKIFTDKILNKSSGLTVKSHIMCVLLQRKDKISCKNLYSSIDLPEMVRACEILDSKRLQKQMAGKLIIKPDSFKVKNKLSQAQELLKDQNVDNIDLSLSLSKIKIVKDWVKSIPKEMIEFRAMSFDTTLWRKLSDLTHLNPKTDFIEGCEWFLPYCFGAPIPDGNIVHDYKNLNYTNFHELYDKHQFSYELIRAKIQLSPNQKMPSTKSTSRTNSKYSKKHSKNNSFNINKQKYEQNKHLIQNIKIKIVNNEHINTIVWYWDELVDTYNVIDVLNRLKNEKDAIDLSYGKIVDLISKTTNPEILKELMILGSDKISSYKIDVEQPVAIFGDQSGSMEIAIKTSGIITSLLCYICNASLHLFHSEDNHITNPPRNIEDAVKFGKEVKTMGCTCPAASLLHYYSKKEIVKTIIIITDEEENQSTSDHEQTLQSYSSQISSAMFGYPMNSFINRGYTNSNKGYRFADLYKKYIEEVYPARLVFISFSDPNKDADMVRDLKQKLGNNIVDELVKVFKFNVTDPDLNRMDIVLKYLASEC